ncbi:MAG: hypothetical protein IT279_02960 [Ignavibacteriaceae bacterium]|nr:hypothetical protein [Ignavibacteriaceae bacterium]
MTIREDDSLEIDLRGVVDEISNKAEMRKFILGKWSEEEPGMKYRYFVETLNNNGRIYLERPGRLNKGCDFVIYMENQLVWLNNNDKPPNHDFILNDLRNKKAELTVDTWVILIHAIKKIYDCESYVSSFSELTALNHGRGHSFELILKTLKWFFIEQDLTYWSGQGRSMLFEVILSIGNE